MNEQILEGMLLDEDCMLSLAEMSRACAIHADWIIELVDEGILEPQGGDIRTWRFQGPQVRRAQTICHLQHDLGVNLAGAALALDLLDEIATLRARLAQR